MVQWQLQKHLTANCSIIQPLNERNHILLFPKLYNEHSGNKRTINIIANMTCQILQRLKNFIGGGEIWCNDLKTCRAVWYLHSSVKVHKRTLNRRPKFLLDLLVSQVGYSPKFSSPMLYFADSPKVYTTKVLHYTVSITMLCLQCNFYLATIKH